MIEIKGIDTIPERDPYHRCTGTATRTILVLDPSAETITVEQRPDPVCSGVSEWEWNGRIITFLIPGHPEEGAVKDELEDLQPRFQRMVDGYSEGWDHESSHRLGHLTEDAQAARDEIQAALDELEGTWGLWSAWDWLTNYPMKTELAARIAAGETIDAEHEATKIEREAYGENIIINDAQRYVEELVEQILRQLD